MKRDEFTRAGGSPNKCSCSSQARVALRPPPGRSRSRVSSSSSRSRSPCRSSRSSTRTASMAASRARPRLLGRWLDERGEAVEGGTRLPRRHGQPLVCTAALDEGLDVSDAAFVVSFSKSATTKSYIQRAGRARRKGARIFLFENDPTREAEGVAQMKKIAGDDSLALTEEERRRRHREEAEVVIEGVYSLGDEDEGDDHAVQREASSSAHPEGARSAGAARQADRGPPYIRAYEEMERKTIVTSSTRRPESADSGRRESR